MLSAKLKYYNKTSLTSASVNSRTIAQLNENCSFSVLVSLSQKSCLKLRLATEVIPSIKLFFGFCPIAGAVTSLAFLKNGAVLRNLSCAGALAVGALKIIHMVLSSCNFIKLPNIVDDKELESLTYGV